MTISLHRSNKTGVHYAINDNKLTIDHKSISFDYSRYFFEECIGDGANGIVFQVRDLLLNRTVAIKFWLIRPDQTNATDKKFKAEIQKIARLESPRIVHIYDGGIIDSVYFYGIYEYVDGISLKQWLSENKTFHRRKKISDNIFQEILECHKEGTFHGDLHPENILITKKDKVKLIDFGTSIFSNIEDSDEREIKKLLETAYKIFPEAKRMRLVDKKALLCSPPHCTPLLLLQLPRMIYAFEKKPVLKEKPDFNEWKEMERYFWVLANQNVSAPFFNLDEILNFIRENYSDIWAIEFIDKLSAAMIREDPSISEVCPRMSIAPNDVLFLKSIYKRFREGFIERIRKEYPHRL